VGVFVHELHAPSIPEPASPTTVQAVGDSPEGPLKNRGNPA
jgi:hypothetical protein